MVRGVCYVLVALTALAGRLPGQAAQDSAGSGDKRLRSCGAALRQYASFEEIGAPHDTLKMPSFSGTFRTREEMLAASREALAATGATGYVTETRVDMTPGGHATRTMSRSIPVFVPSDTLRVRRECTRARTP